MNFLTILLIALGLAMDAFAVSIVCGFTIERLRVGHAFQIATSFGAFQALMPVVGWLAGCAMRSFIAEIDHWIAFGLLTFLGVKMIYESRKIDESEKAIQELKVFMLLLLSIATSLDALVVGLTLSFLHVSILWPCVIIGGVTFGLCLAGVYIGKRVGHLVEGKIEIVGGLVLIGIGVKILVQSL